MHASVVSHAQGLPDINYPLFKPASAAPPSRALPLYPFNRDTVVTASRGEAVGMAGEGRQ
jgi:hypothetical protein